MKQAIFGAGGFATDIMSILDDFSITRFVDDAYWLDGDDPRILPVSCFDPSAWELVVSLGDPRARRLAVERLPRETRYFTVVDDSARICGNATVGPGSVIGANCLLISGTRVGAHGHLNHGTILGHDVVIGDYFTSACGVLIMGRNRIGQGVYFGTAAATKQDIAVCDGAVIGLNAGVVKDIAEPGTYVGTPARRLK